MTLAAPLAPDREEAMLVDRARNGDAGAFATIMRMANQRLFRAARALVVDDSEAEDVVQETYVRAFAALDDFRGEASIFTWLTRIALNEARGRLRRRRNMVDLAVVEAVQEAGGDGLPQQIRAAPTPEAEAARAEIRRMLEAAVDRLPEAFRVVFVLRDVEGCSVAEASEALGVPVATVKTRLHRARRLLREALADQLSGALTGTFPFLGARCDRIVQRVLERLAGAAAVRAPRCPG